ncbi:MAG: aminopeptidase P N-terminal domain-containing protein [Oscillospiraceae bacterium]|nr:aminopeptidase P N-terminal domain-containing protein [Oscillospiraceae bacterium]
MERTFHEENRRELYRSLEEGALFVCFAGRILPQSADAEYAYFANRNFAYLTGLDGTEVHDFVFLAKKAGGAVEETLFVLPPDAMAERWTGRRLKPDEIAGRSGVADIRPLDGFAAAFHAAVMTGKYRTVALDLWKKTAVDPDGEAQRFAARVQADYPFLGIENCHRQLCAQRTIKKPCEIEAMKKAMTVTKAGIEAMMRASRPGMYEYEYKAAYDHALTSRGVLVPAFPSIIAAGENNFCIHYYSYTGQAKDGDMVLNDVGAAWDGMCTDVSRGWPCSGKFSPRQKQLYECAYKTSQHMFSIIRPGMPMADVDRLCHQYCGGLLRETGLLGADEAPEKYMWHGGAHHVGWDVHDQVDMTRPVAAGMVFCVDVGIYVEEWGIGFRLEDNCLVTEDGCVNLSADIPRSIEEIEAFMAK